MKELYQKINEEKDLERESHKLFNNECGKLGIEGKQLKLEVLSMVKELPGIFYKVENILSDPEIPKLIELYSTHIQYYIDPAYSAEKVLPLLRHIILHGDDSLQVYLARVQREGITEELLTINKNK